MNATNAAILATEIDDDAEKWVGHRVAYHIVMGQNPDGRVGPQVRVRCADHDTRRQPAVATAPAAPPNSAAYAQASGRADGPVVQPPPAQPAASNVLLDDEIPF